MDEEQKARRSEEMLSRCLAAHGASTVFAVVTHTETGKKIVTQIVNDGSKYLSSSIAQVKN